MSLFPFNRYTGGLNNPLGRLDNFRPDPISGNHGHEFLALRSGEHVGSQILLLCTRRSSDAWARSWSPFEPSGMRDRLQCRPCLGTGPSMPTNPAVADPGVWRSDRYGVWRGPR